MYDRELVCDILYQILDAVHEVNKRFEPVKTVDDFTNTPEVIGDAFFNRFYLNLIIIFLSEA